jgi:AAA15 family ATPase/GTPase
MLLRMAVSNFRSIAERQELSFVATSLKGPEDGLLDVPASDLKALPGAVIYGANASGKSNFLKAFDFMRSSILFSHRQGNPEGGVPRVAFGLDAELGSTPTSLEADFVVEGTRYQYGFECDSDRFLSEWLYSYPEGKRRKLFERNGSDVEFGQFLTGQKKILVSLMRPNSLFISTATQNGHETLSKIVSFFRLIRHVDDTSTTKEYLNTSFRVNEFDLRAIKFLKNCGTGIVNYRKKDVDIRDIDRTIRTDMMAVIKKNFGNVEAVDKANLLTEKDVEIELAHRGVDGSEHFLGLDSESSGTRRLLLMLSPIFRALDDGSVVMVDELNANLHTHVAEQILLMFADKNINKHGAQLISTTHDTNLLNCKGLRRDQIWFCQKDEIGATHLFPLSDIKSRPTDNFEQGYLEGRYGAIPYAGDLRSLFSDARA